MISVNDVHNTSSKTLRYCDILRDLLRMPEDMFLSVNCSM
jgi:hypothetical protein